MCAPKDEPESSTSAKMADADDHRPTNAVNSDKDDRDDAPQPKNYGPLIGAASLGLLIASSSVTMPHWIAQRDAVGCDDSFCQGSLTSLRSACSLAGAVVTGKWSDIQSPTLQRFGGARRWSLWVGVLGAAISMHFSSTASNVSALRWSVVPAALLQQNLSVLKAVVSEYKVVNDGERASAQGMLGMSAGLAMMVGPVLGATLLPTYQRATQAGYVFLALSALLIAYLPVSQSHGKSIHVGSSAPTKRGGWLSFLDVPSARSPPAIFLLTCRVLSTLSFHIFHTIWMVSLKDRFHFQSAGYGRFMSMIGLFLALSQGSARFVLDFVARLDTVHAQRNRVRLLALCFFTVACARFLVYQTLHLGAIYTLFAVMVTAMGIATTILSADSQRVAAPDELGSFFGLQSALENAAGMAGPLVGGILSNMHRRQYAVQAPLAAVLLLNMVVVLLVAFRYESTVLKTSSEMKAKAD